MNRGQYTRIGHRSWSYDTALTDVLADGRTIGNTTFYSRTTSHHQRMAGVHTCDVQVNGVPQGTADLAAWYAALPKEITQP